VSYNTGSTGGSTGLLVSESAISYGTSSTIKLAQACYLVKEQGVMTLVQLEVVQARYTVKDKEL